MLGWFIPDIENLEVLQVKAKAGIVPAADPGAKEAGRAQESYYVSYLIILFSASWRYMTTNVLSKRIIVRGNLIFK